jgi:hypothetical protein
MLRRTTAAAVIALSLTACSGGKAQSRADPSPTASPTPEAELLPVLTLADMPDGWADETRIKGLRDDLADLADLAEGGHERASRNLISGGSNDPVQVMSDVVTVRSSAAAKADVAKLASHAADLETFFRDDFDEDTELGRVTRVALPAAGLGPNAVGYRLTSTADYGGGYTTDVELTLVYLAVEDQEGVIFCYAENRVFDPTLRSRLVAVLRDRMAQTASGPTAGA